jgi:hypothetical protein
LSERDAAGSLVIFGARRLIFAFEIFAFEVPNGAKHIGGGAGGQYIAAMPGHAGEDLRNLCGRLAGAKNNLWHAGAERAVMIEFGESNVLEREVAETVKGIVHAGLAVANLIEQCFDLRAVH